MTDYSAEHLAWRLMLALLILLPLAFLPWTIEVYIVPKAALLWIGAFGLAALVAASDLRRRELIIPAGPSVTALGVFCLAAVAATLGSPTPVVSLLGAFMRREGLLSLVSYGLIYILVLRLASNKRRVDEGVWALIVPVVPMGLYGLAQAFGFEFVRELNPAGGAVRAYGMLGNADFLGIYGALVLPILVMALTRTRGWRRGYVGIALFLDGVALLFSYSRGGWLGAAVGAMVLLVLLGGERVRRHWRPLLVSGVLLGAAVALAVGLRAVQQAPPETGFVQRAASVASVGSGTAATRLTIWPRALGLIARRPVFGFGPETFRGQFMPARGERIVRLEGTSRWDRPHNSLLYVATSTGLVGLVAYLAFFASVVGTVLRARAAGPGRGGLAPALVAGAAGSFTSEFFVFWSPATTPLIFAALGLAVASVNVRDPERVSMRMVRLPAWGSVAGIGLAVVLACAATWVSVESVRADYYADLGRLALKQGMAEISRQAYDRAVATAPWINDYRWRAARGWEQAGFLSRSADDLRTAEAVLKDGLRFDPYDEQSYAQLGEAYRYLATLTGADTMEQAVAAYSTALKLDPFSPEAGGGLAHISFSRREYRQSIEQAERVLAFDPKNRGLLMLTGYAYEQLGEKGKARAYFERVLKLDRRFTPAQKGLERLGS